MIKNEDAIVSGSDVSGEEFQSNENLQKAGIISEEFKVENIKPDINLVIYSSAFDENNIERKRASELGVEQINYADALAAFAANKKVIVITGTHGKTTTTALLGQIFEAGNLDPVVLAGDRIKAWENSVRIGHGEFMIVEGDEYQEKFRLFRPVAILIPSLDYDHPDYFKTPEIYLEAFKKFVTENPDATLVTTKETGERIGKKFESADFNDEVIFNQSKFLMPGEKYKSNCLLAIHLSQKFGIASEKIISGINNFKGVGRRLDLYTKEGAKPAIIYDYAHHPEEIVATLDAISQKYPSSKIIAVFQPHTFSRTAAFLNDFAKAFTKADEVYFDEIYASAREKIGAVSIKDLIRETEKAGKLVCKLSEFSLEKFASKIKKHPDTIILFMGAGDIWQKAKKIANLI